jgi:hypothetical protein
MSETSLAIFGISAGLLNLVASIPYFIDIFRGNTEPERATWWMWFALSTVGLFAQLAAGARWSLILAISSAVVGGATAVLSVKYGYGKFHRRDGVALAITAIGIALSIIFNSPLIAVSTVVLIDAIAGALTIYKTWYAPRTESHLAWGISTVAVTCGLLAVGQYHPAIFLAPLTNFIINILMLAIITFRRNKIAAQPADI